jgi:hypothetical protein
LNGKLVAGTNISLTEGSDGGNETLTVAATSVVGADVASAAALSVGTGNYFDVTGTTGITSINSVSVGTVIKLHFDGVVTLTHHATDLILPGGTDITTIAGDELEFVEYQAGDWRCTGYVTKVVQATNHVRAGNTQIPDGSLTLSYFDVTGSVTQSAFETLGPTGSGATNIYADMDDMPSNARIMIADIQMQISPVGTGIATLDCYACAGDVSPALSTNNNRIAEMDFDADAATTSISMLKRAFIPLDSSQICKVSWAHSGQSTSDMRLHYRGFITD